MEPLLIDYAKYLEPEDESTPRAIHERLQSWRDSTWVLDDAEMLRSLAEIADELDTENDLNPQHPAPMSVPLRPQRRRAEAGT